MPFTECLQYSQLFIGVSIIRLFSMNQQQNVRDSKWVSQTKPPPRFALVVLDASSSHYDAVTTSARKTSAVHALSVSIDDIHGDARINNIVLTIIDSG